MLKKDEIIFELFTFINSSNAMTFFNQNRTKIVQKRRNIHFERQMSSKNHCKYTLETNEVYDVISCIEAIVVRISSNPDDADEILEILKTIHY